MSLPLPLRKILKNSTPVELDGMCPSEKNAVRALLNQVILEGKTYPQEQPLSETEFAAYWLVANAFVVRAIGDTTVSAPGEVLGAFYLKPNFPGRCSHIGNAGFIVQPEHRGSGIGRSVYQRWRRRL